MFSSSSKCFLGTDGDEMIQQTLYKTTSTTNKQTNNSWCRLHWEKEMTKYTDSTKKEQTDVIILQLYLDSEDGQEIQRNCKPWQWPTSGQQNKKQSTAY